MCTSVAFSAPRKLFGRTLDLEYSFGQQVVITPRNHPLHFHRRSTMAHHLAMIGMATVDRDTALYAEAMNEKGLYMAGLNFPGNAYYTPPEQAAADAVAPYELIPLVLGRCETLAQAEAILKGIDLLCLPFAPGYPVAPLHWHIADGTGSMVLEVMEDGAHLYPDPVGVLTNNPPFPYQQMNLSNYQTLSPHPPRNTFAPELPLAVYGQGMGALGLPGDVSPMSRFVRAAFLKENALFTGDEMQDVTQFFHILDGVSMVRGSVITPERKPDLTLYASCADASHGVYYYKTYENHQINGVRFTEALMDGAQLCCYPLENQQHVHWVN